jgi:hypothetical protein
MLPQLPYFSVNSLLMQIVQILFLIGFALYIVFAFIATRQIDVMRKTVVTPLSPFIQVIGYLHLLLAIGAFFFVFLILR